MSVAGATTPRAGGAGLRLIEKLYRLVLRGYPAAFRRETADELLVAFRQANGIVASAGGLRSARSSALRELIDLIRNLPREWRDPSSHGPGLRPVRAPGGGLGAWAFGLIDDGRHAARALRRQPGFVLAVVMVIGLGLGAATTVFSVIDAILLEPLPYPDADELLYLTETFRVTQSKSVAYPNYVDWRDRNRTFVDMGARTWRSFNLTGQTEARELSAVIMTPNLLPLLGVQPLVGRLLLENDADHVMLSHALASSLYASPEEAIGQTLILDAEPFVVVGVMAADLEFPLWGADLFAPITLLGESQMAARSNHPGISVIGRLRAGVDRATAQADLEAVAAQLAAEYPENNAESGIRVVGLQERLVSNDATALWILMGAVMLVLLGVCANLANLMLVRATKRGSELAIRSAMGAGRGRLIRQLMLEAMLLVSLGAAVGLVVAALTGRMVRGWQPADLPRVGHVEVDASVALFTVILAAAVGLAFGALPAIRAARVDPARTLGGGVRGATGAGAARMRGLLVASEVALAVVLLVGAGLMVRTIGNLMNADPGMRTESVLTARVAPPAAAYPETADRAELYRELLAKIAARPGVIAVGGIDPLPLSGYNRQWAIGPDGFDSIDENGLRTDVANVTPGYFEAMGIPLLAGRDFRGDETEANLNAIVDVALAERLWPGDEAVGRRFRFRGDDSDWFTVVGVVGSVKPYGVAEESRVQMYMPYTTNVWGLSLVVHVDGEPATALPFVRQALDELDPNLPLTRVSTIQQLFDDTIAAQEMVTRLLAVFAAAALALSILGLYAVLSYSVAQRRRELGIRIALGAGRGRVVAAASRQALLMTLLGVGAGALVAAGTGRLLGSLLFEVEAFDLATVAIAALITLAMAGVATLAPALRAAHVDPREALQGD